MKLILAFIAAIRGLVKRFLDFITCCIYFNPYKVLQQTTILVTNHVKSNILGDDDYTYDDISIDDLMSMGDPLSKWGQTQAGF